MVVGRKVGTGSFNILFFAKTSAFLEQVQNSHAICDIFLEEATWSDCYKASPHNCSSSLAHNIDLLLINLLLFKINLNFSFYCKIYLIVTSLF